MDALFPERGFQTNLCFDGLNCFNSSEFRRDLSSALNGLVQPNEVRLLPPQDCKTPENSVADFCGLWPRYPLYAANQECVCSHPESVQVPQVDQFVAYKQKCFFTIGPSYIGLNIGLKVDSDSQVELLSHRAATVGDCADWCAETRNCHAFLYHHSLLTCELRQGQSLGQEAASAHCPSTSKACLERVLEAIFPLDSTGLIPGMQMYFLLNYPSEDPQNMPPPSTITPERYRMCRVLSSIGRACRSPSASKGAEGRGTPNRVFDELENPIISARGGTGMHSPSDSMYAVVRLRADTATMLSRALDILRNGEASQYGAGQGRFTDFLKRRNVLQIFESVDKKVTAPVSTEAAFIPAERNLMDSKNLLCGAAAEIAGGGCKYTYLSSSAWCDKAGKPTNVARCSASHNHKPFCHVVWGTVRAYVQQVVCPEGKGSPECSAGGVPSCSNADNLFDDDSSGPETVWEANKFEAGVEADFVTVSFSNDISQHVDYVEVTRIDVQELQEVESGEADSLRVLELVFSDGKTQQLNLAGNVRVSNPAEADVAPSQQRGSATMQVFYIEPAVTHLLTIRIPRNFYEHQSTTPRRRGLRVLRVWGQPLSAVWQGSIIQMDKPGYTASGALDCPPTTFYSPNRHSCVHCPYPKVSRGKSSTAFRENEIKDTESIAVLHDEPACTCPVCGDGGLQWEGDEKCDDGNTANDDGCDSSCKVEVLWLCTGPVDSNLVGLPEDSYKTPDQCFRIGSAWVPFGEMAVPGGPRFGAAAILHNDAMWLFGGMSSGYRSTFATGVAEATNGANCLLRAPSDSCDNFPSGTALEWLIASGESYTPWSGRAFLSAVTFQENVFVLGGLQSECSDVSCEPSLTLGDVWKSTAVSNVDQSGTSFIDWAQVTPQAAWSSRARAAVVVFKNAIWLLGGQAISGPRGGRTYRVYNDVWVSSNGADWTRLLLNAGWSPRCGHTSLVFANQNREAIYVMGGSDTSRYFNDVWMSYTGTNWTRLTASASFPGRWLHTSLVFRNNLWVIGGHSCVAPAGTQDPDGYGCTRINKDPGNFYNDVWFSSDGVTWRASTQNAKWSPRAGHSSIVFPSKGRENIWVIGGYHAFGDALNDTFAAFTF
jgi:cysteine-rich repeat protein